MLKRYMNNFFHTLHCGIHGRSISKVSFDKLDIGSNIREIGFESGLQVIQYANAFALFNQTMYEVRPNKARPTSNKIISHKSSTVVY